MVRKRNRYKLTVAEAIQVIQQATEGNPEKSDLTAMNVVLKAGSSEALDLVGIATAFAGPFSKKVFPAPSPRSLSPACTILVFRAGSLICIGTKKVEEAVLAVHRLASSMIRDQHHPTRIVNLTVHNQAGIFSLGFYVNLAQLMEKYPDKCWYEPAMFGGLTYTPGGRNHSPVAGAPKTNRMSFIVFYTGRCVVTGGSSVADMQAAVDKCMPLLESLRVSQQEATTKFLQLLPDEQVIKRASRLLDKASDSFTNPRVRAKERREKKKMTRKSYKGRSVPPKTKKKPSGSPVPDQAC